MGKKELLPGGDKDRYRFSFLSIQIILFLLGKKKKKGTGTKKQKKTKEKKKKKKQNQKNMAQNKRTAKKKKNQQEIFCFIKNLFFLFFFVCLYLFSGFDCPNRWMFIFGYLEVVRCPSKYSHCTHRRTCLSFMKSLPLLSFPLVL